MDNIALVAFIRAHRWAIEASSSLDGAPQAAIIGVAVTANLELVFDTLASSRKAANLRANPRIALVIGGWNDAEPRTLQYEGDADFPVDIELHELRQIYFAAFADGPGRLSLPDITCVRVKPRWIRFSDFTVEPPTVTEQEFHDDVR